MSNSIWHKKHVFVVDKNGQVVVKLDDGTYDIIWARKDKPLQDVIVFSENGIKFIEEYCYIDDLIAQADKAERLQKAVNTALISIGTAAIFDGEDAKKYAEAKIDLIKQLIKGE